jgi:predicted amidohydrolase
METTITIAAYQGHAIYNNIPHILNVIKETLVWAEQENVDILCFPECFLQGYILDSERASSIALDLTSSRFARIAALLMSSKTTIILGLIEKEEDHLYNTAVVIEEGQLMGKYRKRYIHTKEMFFTAGTETAIFVKNGVRYGINICYDSRFPESAYTLVKQGAQIIFCPFNNSLPHAKADEWRDKHIQYLITKARQSNCWIVSADVVEHSATNKGYGCTAVLNPQGEVQDYLEHLKVNKFAKAISIQ